jgi:gluconate 2-dehydrogenase gamma chain
MAISRRSLLELAVVAAIPRRAEAALPDDSWTRHAWARVSASPPSPVRILDAQQRATISAIADALIPRSETPGALDVGTVDFVELLLAEWASDDDRTTVERGLTELEARAMREHGHNWPALDAATATADIAWAEARAEQPTAGQRALRRIKSWTVHAWITSEPIQKTVIRTNITPGKYEGCVPVPTARGAR